MATSSIARTKGPSSGTLVLEDLHDYAQIYLDGKLVGTLDRRLGEKQMNLEVKGAKAQLDILVENSGRINFATMPPSLFCAESGRELRSRSLSMGRL